MIFWAVAWPPCLIRFFPTGAGDLTYLAGFFFSLMQEILHAWREIGRNSVQAGDSLSMRESWKPCRSRREKCNFQNQFVQLPGFCRHFTENQCFISNKILTTIICLFLPPFHYSFMIRYWLLSFIFLPPFLF